jgi:MFS family permease
MRSRRYYPRFRGWWIVGVSFLALYLNGSSTSYLFGVLLLPMEADLGWSRATLLGALTVSTFVTAGTGMLMGPFYDKHGARVGMTISALISGAALLLLPHVTAPWQYYALLGVGMGIGRAGLENMGPRTAISNWFVRRRAAAFAWYSGGRAVFGVTAVAPFAYLVSATSWRSGWTVIGALELVLLVPLIWIIVRRRPEDHGQLPDGDTPRPDTSAVSLAEPEWTSAQALRTKAFWFMVLGFAFVGFPTSGMISNMLPYFSDKGLSLGMASAAFSMFGFGALTGRPIWGFVSTRLGVHPALTLYAVVYGLSIASMVLAFDGPSLFAAAFFVGVPTGGAAQLQAQAWPDFFGRRSVGAITGISTLIIMPTLALGPLIAAIAFDLLGSYDFVFSAFAVGALVSSLFFYLARRPSQSSSVSRTSS